MASNNKKMKEEVEDEQNLRGRGTTTTVKKLSLHHQRFQFSQHSPHTSVKKRAATFLFDWEIDNFASIFFVSGLGQCHHVVD
jgi:hypothetical protein